jgi:hypothetical protein
VISLLSDVNIEGHVAVLASFMQGEYWRDYWDYLQIRVLRFEDVGLSQDETDAEIWRYCQDQQLVLLTNNRNDDGPESLEATIRAQNAPACLPVFTFSDADLLLFRKDYRERVAESLIDQLLRIESLRGTGRLFLP